MSTQSNKFIIPALAGFVFLLNIPSSYASEFRYDSVSVGYTTIDDDNLNKTSTGYSFGLTSSINKDMFFSASYGETSFDTTTLDKVITTAYTIGIGLHHPLNLVTDFITLIGVVEGSVKSSGITTDANGYYLGMGTRSMLNDKLESNVRFIYSKVEAESDYGFSVGVAYSMIPDLQVSFDLVFGGNQTKNIGLLYYY